MATKKSSSAKGSKKRATSKSKGKRSVSSNEERVIARADLEKLIYGHSGVRRFTQDSPVLPDVWFQYGENPTARVDLLLNPNFKSSPGVVAQAVEERLANEQKTPRNADFICEDNSSSDIAYNQSTVVVRLCFHEMIRVVLPLTEWWTKYVWVNDGQELRPFLSDSAGKKRLARYLEGESEDVMAEGIAPEVLWMMKVIGTLAAAARKGYTGKPLTTLEIIDACADLLLTFQPAEKKWESIVWSVARNRKATTTVWRSTMAVKADAARRLFEISCKNLTWAVIDSGIDARHPAFRNRGADEKASTESLDTRVKETYDFTVIRYLLRPDQTVSTEVPGPQKRLLEKAMRRLRANREEAQQLQRSLKCGRNVDWELLKPLIRVPHDKNYIPPVHPHGTHVAGILAADWRPDDEETSGDHPLSGVCPDIGLFDLRVLDDQGQGDEFSVIAAMQFVRYLNAHKELMVVHGINLSLSIKHDVANYACGSTPVCEEANRLVGGGIVVVAAAGNSGYLYFMTSSGAEEGYRSISITDPGNTESVITVGATHRESAHTYGVSYFSSRGPTGDGRSKPDLVAPGEKIVSTIPDGDNRRMDGTSMAAPHVSGVAALLLARYPELVGRPSRIKEILCKTATDLGRERYFQGSGMVDALRALQSV